jgi:N-acyl amino acid synthase of PEP-CTERM/exosortase system
VRAHSLPTRFDKQGLAVLADHPRPIDAFRRYFEVRPADTEADLDRVFCLRYQVYCVENAFENPDEHPSGRETDAFDSHARHALLVHRPSGQAMGTVRLVLPLPAAPEDSFPFQELCDDPSAFDPARLPIMRTGEVSRFSISKSFRRRPGDTHHGMTDPDRAETPPPDIAERRVLPNMMVGLVQGLLRLSVANGVTHWCAVMEPTLLRLLARTGIHMQPIGSPVIYHGTRQPCFSGIAALLSRLRAERPDIWEIVTDDGSLWDALDRGERPAAEARDRVSV